MSIFLVDFIQIDKISNIKILNKIFNGITKSKSSSSVNERSNGHLIGSKNDLETIRIRIKEKFEGGW